MFFCSRAFYAGYRSLINSSRKNTPVFLYKPTRNKIVSTSRHIFLSVLAAFKASQLKMSLRFAAYFLPIRNFNISWLKTTVCCAQMMVFRLFHRPVEQTSQTRWTAILIFTTWNRAIWLAKFTLLTMRAQSNLIGGTGAGNVGKPYCPLYNIAPICQGLPSARPP